MATESTEAWDASGESDKDGDRVAWDASGENDKDGDRGYPSSASALARCSLGGEDEFALLLEADGGELCRCTVESHLARSAWRLPS